MKYNISRLNCEVCIHTKTCKYIEEYKLKSQQMADMIIKIEGKLPIKVTFDCEYRQSQLSKYKE